MTEWLITTIVDAAQTPVFMGKSGEYSGISKKVMKLFPWTFQLQPFLVTDAIETGKVGAYLNITKDLWIYFVAHDDKHFPVNAYIFNGAVAKLESGKTPPRHSTTDEALKALKNAIVASFVFSTMDQAWKAVN